MFEEEKRIEAVRQRLIQADAVSKGETDAIETLRLVVNRGWVSPYEVHTLAERVLLAHGLIERDDDDWGWWATEFGCLVELACCTD